MLFKSLYVKEWRTILPTGALNGEECSAGGGERTDNDVSFQCWRSGKKLYASSNLLASFPAQSPLEKLCVKI